ncbi:hypothetical protein G6F37_002771 [Rhizopus arrhizus]|nr:hypothetical protein G6F38_007725 [Rhizopus arrhizus]KAG1161771.1 hypothetical protein G6F37_002771 [Rhizopus arrhizus]
MIELFYIVPYFMAKAMKDQQRKKMEQQLIQEYLQKQKEMEEANAERAKKEENDDESEEEEDESKDKIENENKALYHFLAGKKMRKSGLVIDKKSGAIIGRLVEGNAKELAHKRIDEHGIIKDEEGNVIGRVEPIDPNNNKLERVDSKDGIPAKDTKLNNTNQIEQATDKEKNTKQGIKEPTADKQQDNVEKSDNKRYPDKHGQTNKHSPKVRKSGRVVDKDGNVVGKVDKHIAPTLAGFKVDDEGNVVDHDCQIVGKARMIKKKSRKEHQRESRKNECRKLANDISNYIQQSNYRIKPILKVVLETISQEEQVDKSEHTEQKLVKDIKALTEQAVDVLCEAHDAIQRLDPDGKTVAMIQKRSSKRKISPEESQLAECLSQLIREVITTIDQSKKKLKHMLHVTRQLSPVWCALQSSLLRILSTVGLLFTDVLGLVGKLLNDFGLGSIVNSLLGGTNLKELDLEHT